MKVRELTLEQFAAFMNPFRCFAVFAVMGTLFFLSAQPGDSIDLPDIVNIDKVLHAIAYGGLALTALIGIPEEKYLRHPYWISLFVVLFCLVYGISDEFHQSFVPGRYPSVLDLVADTMGAIIVVLIWFKMKKE